MLMYDENIKYGDREQRLVAEFRKESSRMGFSNQNGIYDADSTYWLNIKNLRKKILKFGSVQYVTDVLVRGLFKEHHVRKKSAFWDCFGDTVYENLQNNLPAKTRLCAQCGRRFIIQTPSQQYCNTCKAIGIDWHKLEVHTAECVICGSAFRTSAATSGAICPACKYPNKKEKHIPIKNRERFCVDCGVPLDTYVFGRPSNRCPHCQNLRNKDNVIKWKKKKRLNSNLE